MTDIPETGPAIYGDPKEYRDRIITNYQDERRRTREGRHLHLVETATDVESSTAPPNGGRKWGRLAVGSAVTLVLIGAAYEHFRPAGRSAKPTEAQIYAKSHNLGVAREFTAQAGDSPWSIDAKAGYPEDAGAFSYNLLQTLPNDVEHAHGLQVGDEVLLPSDSKIGDEVLVDTDIQVPTYVEKGTEGTAKDDKSTTVRLPSGHKLKLIRPNQDGRPQDPR